MANFGSYFLRNFSPNFANTFNTSYRHGLDQQEEERKRQELLKQQQKQQGVLSQLIGGNKIDASYRGMYSPLDVTQTPLNSNEKFWLYSQLNPTNQNAYEYWQKQNEPQKKDYYQFDNKLYEKSPDGSIDINKPIATKQDNVAIEQFVPAETVKGLEGFKGYKVKVTKKGDQIQYGQPFKRTREGTDENGNVYQTLDKNFQNELKQRTDRFLTALDIKSAADQTTSGIPYTDPLTGMKYTINSQTADEMVQSGKNQLQNFLDTNGSASNDKYFNDIIQEADNNVKSQGKGDLGVTSWKYIEEDYKKGDISEADFLEARYRFIAKWGYDPTTRLRNGR